jgi:hypothetical protein
MQAPRLPPQPQESSLIGTFWSGCAWPQENVYQAMANMSAESKQQFLPHLPRFGTLNSRMPKSSTVFISHRSADSGDAERLAADLKARGHKVWLDVWEIAVGDSITQKINDGLEGSVFLILCLSEQGVLSPWMSREWLSGLARQLNGGNVKILPLRLTGGSPPAILADIKFADAVKDYATAFGELVGAIEK